LDGNFNHPVSKATTPPKLDGNFNHPVSKATTPPKLDGNFNHPVSKATTPPKLDGNFNHPVSKATTPKKLDGNFNHLVSKVATSPHWCGINVNASFYDIREYFQGRDDKGRMNSSSDDERYNDLIRKLRIELKELAKQIEPKIYEYGFLKE
jgi:hypothetical protein